MVGKLALCVAFLCATGCSGADDEDEEDDEKAEAAVAACHDFSDTLVDRGVECAEELGGSVSREELEDELAGVLPCEDALDIDDPAQFYDECLPATEMMSCADLVAGEAPETCEGQLLF